MGEARPTQVVLTAPGSPIPHRVEPAPARWSATATWCCRSIPQPAGDDDEAAFEADLRDGGYQGQVTVGRDLTTIEVDNPRGG